jgi:crotonobetainyl-CoA:carnitine CoA-transferase CaiB-like acyl-CoA transferase
MPCHTLGTCSQDPHLEAVGLVTFDQHPTEGRSAAIRSSIRFDGDFPLNGTPAQPRGQETRAILRKLGYAGHEIDAMASSGAALTQAKDV